MEKKINEVEKWEKRVFYPTERFKPDTKADLDKLDKFLNKSKDKFLIISSSSAASVYKIGHYMVEKGLTNDNIAFQDPSIFDIYIDIDSRYDYQLRDRCKELCESIKESIKNKWLIIPCLENVWNKKVATYFINEISLMGCYGILFYAPKEIDGNLAKILCEETYADNIIQFPEVVYENIHKGQSLPDDGY